MFREFVKYLSFNSRNDYVPQLFSFGCKLESMKQHANITTTILATFDANANTNLYFAELSQVTHPFNFRSSNVMVKQQRFQGFLKCNIRLYNRPVKLPFV